MGKRTVPIPQHTAEMLARVVAKIAPPPKLTLSEWADNYRRLSQGTSAMPGKWRTSKAPYQKEIMDAISDNHVRKVVVMSAAQIGKTDALVLNTIGYYMKYAPAPIMVMQPSLEMGQGFSKERLTPMLHDTPCLRGMVDDRSRMSGNTILQKKFPGGLVVIVGANSPASLASRPIKVLLADEIDRYPAWRPSGRHPTGTRRRFTSAHPRSRDRAGSRWNLSTAPKKSFTSLAQTVDITSRLCGQTSTLMCRSRETSATHANDAAWRMRSTDGKRRR